jgi:hypothetical protein
VLFVASGVSLLAASPARAYIDPGTGGYVVQLLVGGVAGALVVIKLYWSKLAGILRRQREQDDADNDSA